MVNKCTRNSSLRMYFKGHAAYNGLTENTVYLLYSVGTESDYMVHM